jgi:PhnB protein
VEAPANGVRLAPYINFRGHCREAMELYQRVLGGSLRLFAVDEQGTPRPAGPGDRIAHAQLSADGATIVGSDGHPDYPPTVGDNIGISLSGSDRDRMAAAFEGLSDGGQVKMPLTDAAWGSSGWLADRFGIVWSINVERA